MKKNRKRVCGDRCHNSKFPKCYCKCVCGGAYHGSAGTANRALLTNAKTEKERNHILREHGFDPEKMEYRQQMKFL